MIPDLFEQAPNGGVFHVEKSVWAKMEALAARHQLGRLASDCRNNANLTAILEQLGRDLNFPDWYGANLDALTDCLGDTDWQGQPALFMLRLSSEFCQSTDGSFGRLVEVLQAVTEVRAGEQTPMWIILDQPSSAHSLPPSA